MCTFLLTVSSKRRPLPPLVDPLRPYYAVTSILILHLLSSQSQKSIILNCEWYHVSTFHVTTALDGESNMEERGPH